MNIRSMLVSAALALAAGCAPALADTATYTASGGLVAVTNNSSFEVWQPEALFVVFTNAVASTVTVDRVYGGVTSRLARHEATAKQVVAWLPPADYPIRPGAVLRIAGPGTFRAQLERGPWTRRPSPPAGLGADSWLDDGVPAAAAAGEAILTEPLDTDGPDFQVGEQITVLGSLLIGQREADAGFFLTSDHTQGLFVDGMGDVNLGSNLGRLTITGGGALTLTGWGGLTVALTDNEGMSPMLFVTDGVSQGSGFSGQITVGGYLVTFLHGFCVGAVSQ